MMQSNLEQLWQIFACLGCGVWLGCGYDLLRAYRLWRGCGKHIVFLQDTVYVLFATVCLFLFTLAVNGGELRPDILLSVMLGFWLCRRTAGRLFIAATRAAKQFAAPLAHIGVQIGDFTANFTKKIMFFSKKGLRRLSLMLYNMYRK